MFYSQFGQDKYFNELFKEDYKGVCIEIGAYDGITGSNTLYFENKGWNCLCIEGNYDAYIKCTKIRKNTLNYCVSNENNDNSIFTVFNLEGENQSAISSLKPDNRLIESHSNLIINKFEQNVKSRTLTTILNEINFSQDIDFISIDTENTEIDVLNGIDFDNYNIKYILIENNFNEDKCHNFLINKGYKKINRIGVDDIYMKDNILYLKCKNNRFFKIITAYYHVYNKCEQFNCNVIDIVNNHYNEYLNDNTKKILQVVNEIFGDKCPHFKKKFYLNYQSIIGERSLIIDEFSELNWELIINLLEKEYKFYKNPLHNISIGELINKNIYNNVINNKEYLIYKEIIEDDFKNLYDKYEYFFDLLVYLNKNYIIEKNKYNHIDFLNTSFENLNYIKNITYNVINTEIKINKVINYFNNFVGVIDNKYIKNSENNIYILINNENDLLNKIAEINYLCIEYDNIYLHQKYQDIIKSIFKNSNIIFETYNKLHSLNTILLQDYNLNKDLKDIYKFKPIKYICGGLLGDFLNSLSVINENFYKSGRPGILYISDSADMFTFGTKKAYEDLYNIVISQNYICEFKIYNNESYDINLNIWRDFIKIPTYNYTQFYNWKNIFSFTFDIEWAKHKWINNIYYDELWSNKTVINMTMKRPINNITELNKIILNNDNIFFITFNEKEYDYFIEKYNSNKNLVKIHLLKSFDELCVIINSCKDAYLGVSSFAVVANALHKNHSIFSSDELFGNFTNNLVNILPHVLDFF